MGLFSACVVVLDLPTWPARQRIQLKAQLTAQGAVISNSVTSRCTHLVVSGDGAGSDSRLKLAAKHGVRVVHPEFLTRCLATGQLPEPVLADSADNNNRNDDDEVRERERENRLKLTDTIRGLPAEETLDLNKVKIWADDDNNCPAFPEEFEIVRSAIFHKPSENEQRCAVMEIQAATHSGGLVFRVTVSHATFRRFGKVTKKRTEVRMAGSGREAEMIFGCVFEVLTGEGCGMVMVNKLPASLQLGSRMFQQAQTEISMVNLRLSRDVGRFVTFVWSEALGHFSQILQIPVLEIKPQQVTKAEAVLLQLKKALLSKDGQDEDALAKLSKEFYKTIPHHPANVSPLGNMANISAKLDLCQLIRDVVDASEAVGTSVTPGTWEGTGRSNIDDIVDASKEGAKTRRALMLARFTALRCSLLHLEPSSREFDSVRSQLLQSSHGRLDGFKILKIFCVERPAEIGQFRSEVGNTRSLFHAFNPRSLLGILSRGLLLPKTVVGEFGGERTDIGMLGCGIYFSDSISTSVKYASRSAAQDGTRVLAVCDVALGNCHDVHHRDPSLTGPPEGHHSLHGVRATDGATSEFEDDEFVIYDPRQQKLRYIVQFCLDSDVVKDEGSDIQEFNDIEAVTAPSDETDVILEHYIPELQPEQGEAKKQALCGLTSGAGSPVPLKAVHVRAKILDFTAQVVVMQEYGNESTEPIEAKYTFPLDDMAAVCGFEAFINGKHIVGQVKEKETAHQQYREAVSQGHGAYLMDKESPDVFVVSVGNLPPACRVLIKVTYVCELTAEGAAVCFRLPGNLAPWQQRLAAGDATQETVETLEVTKHSGRLSVQASVEMPCDIVNITSPTHAIHVKRTACKAVVELASGDASLGSEFQLLVFLATIYEPRMWVEHNPETDSQACMLTLYMELKARGPECVDIALCLDCSASMATQSLVDAKRLALFALRHLPANCRFNVIKFGTHYKELFPIFREANQSNIDSAASFIKRLQANAGNTELWRPLRSLALLAGGAGESRDAAVPVTVLLLTDGVVQAEERAVQEARENVRLTRVLACGVGETPNRHFLNALARNSGGACEIFTHKNKSMWTNKMLSLLEKTTQPACRDIAVEWQRFDYGGDARDNRRVELQAPRMIRSVFFGSRLVIYGFVQHCTQATLRAVANNEEFSVVVSTSGLQITRGKMVHRLTAHAIIQDYEDGNQHSDEAQHEVVIAEMKNRIIELSKEYSIITPYTSFVAVEERDPTLADEARGPELDELLSKECVDILPYMSWQVDEESESQRRVDVEEHTEDGGEVVIKCQRRKMRHRGRMDCAMSADAVMRKTTLREELHSKPEEALLITPEIDVCSMPKLQMSLVPLRSVTPSEVASPEKEPRHESQESVRLLCRRSASRERRKLEEIEESSGRITARGGLFSGSQNEQQPASQPSLFGVGGVGGGGGGLFGSQHTVLPVFAEDDFLNYIEGSAAQRDSEVSLSSSEPLHPEPFSIGASELHFEASAPPSIRPFSKPIVPVRSAAKASAPVSFNAMTYQKTEYVSVPQKLMAKRHRFTPTPHGFGLRSDEPGDLVPDGTMPAPPPLSPAPGDFALSSASPPLSPPPVGSFIEMSATKRVRSPPHALPQFERIFRRSSQRQAYFLSDPTPAPPPPPPPPAALVIGSACRSPSPIPVRSQMDVRFSEGFSPSDHFAAPAKLSYASAPPPPSPIPVRSPMPVRFRRASSFSVHISALAPPLPSLLKSSDGPASPPSPIPLLPPASGAAPAVGSDVLQPPSSQLSPVPFISFLKISQGDTIAYRGAAHPGSAEKLTSFIDDSSSTDSYDGECVSPDMVDLDGSPFYISRQAESSITSVWQRVDLSKILHLQNKDGFWDGGMELSSLIGWSPDHLTIILKNKGIQSLGLRVEEVIVRLVWTLLMLQILRLRAQLDVALKELLMLLLRRDAHTLAVLEAISLGSADALPRAASWVRATENVCPFVCTRLELGPSWQAATCSLLGTA